jgi:hypothetical protein
VSLTPVGAAAVEDFQGVPKPAGMAVRRGSRTEWCNGGYDGTSGPQPSPSDLDRGSDGTVEGAKGAIFNPMFAP